MSEKIVEDAVDACCAAGGKRSNAGALAAVSAVLASACCGVPLLLVAVGLGGLGLGSFLGAHRWYFTGAGILLLAAAWLVFWRENARLRAAGRGIRQGGMTPALLAAATAAVLGFASLNAATALGWGSKARYVGNASSGFHGELAEVVVPVEGMSCIACEWQIEEALERLDGVIEAGASASERKVLVRYDPRKLSLDDVIRAVSSTGYEASMPDPS